MTDNTTTPTKTSPPRAEDEKHGFDKWDDPNIPVGNSPPLSNWPIAATGLAWVAWVVFLVCAM